MKERPILFSGAMVRAILEKRKTQTRRICKIAYHAGEWAAEALPAADGMPVFWWNGWSGKAISGRAELTLKVYDTGSECPWGKVGDRLWVRETWRETEHDIEYRADTRNDGPADGSADQESKHWRPSIHMPRTHSRITLEIVSVRVERVQDISEEDVRAEGVEGLLLQTRPDGHYEHVPYTFQHLWNSINTKPEYTWESNPFVWAITFKRVLP